MPLIFSDDLTGACDVGAQCLASGWRVRVEFGGEGWGSVAPPARDEVVVADLETRRLPPREAGVRTGCAGRAFMRRGLRPAVFKMDSTLRGNYLVEARALLRAVRAPRAWIVPANPGQGRWTVEGRVFVNGIPLEATEYARDPLHPVRSGKVGGERAGNLRLDGGWSPAGSGKARICSADAVTGDDLARIARRAGKNDLVFGASSIAGYVIGKPRKITRSAPVLAGNWLGVVGSLNPLTELQVRRAGRVPGVRVSWIGPGPLLAGKIPRVPVGIRFWIIALAPSSFRRLLGGRGSLALGNRIAEKLGVLGRACMEAFHPSGLVLSGGLTAIGVCGKMGITGLDLSEELSQGLVASRAVWNGPALEIITKPGGFGSPDALMETAERIRRANR